MITRIVKMTFILEKIPDFLKIFEASKPKIRSFKGCTHLELLNEVNAPNIFFTLSKWESEKDLESYRNSELFKSTWAKTKILFAEKADAWTVRES